MGAKLDKPVTEKHGVAFDGEGLRGGVTGMQGFRFEMEDEHILGRMPSLSSHVLVAVFDGHGGRGSATYAYQNLVRVVEGTSEWKRYIESGEDPVKSIGDALKAAFFLIDEEIKVSQSAEDSRDSSGCTAVCAMITPNYIICANAGDSRCVMGSAGLTIPLSEDHKPDGEIEKQRVENAGGWVDMNTKRVNGDLAVSRALGDFSYKNRDDLPAKEQKVSCEPDIRVHDRTPKDDILLVACDGLWDVFSSSAAIEFAREILASGETNPLLVAEELIDAALDRGSTDNISCACVFLSPDEAMGFGPISLGGVEKRRAVRQEQIEKDAERRQREIDESKR